MTNSKLLFHVLGFAILFLFCGFVKEAHAQNIKGSAFYTSNAWLVGPPGLEQAEEFTGAKLPCVMSNQYNNGFVVRFTGGGEKFLAMAIDFRQAIFDHDKYYDVEIISGEKYQKNIRAKAFGKNVLIFNLVNEDNFYTTVKNNKFIQLNLGQNELNFSLDKFYEAIQRLEQCYGSPSEGSIKDAVAPPPPLNVKSLDNKKVDNQFVVKGKEPIDYMRQETATTNSKDKIENTALNRGKEALERSSRNELQNSNKIAGGEEIIAQRAQPKDIVSNQDIQNSIPKETVSWKASANENIQSVLQRWANKADTDLVWSTSSTGVVEEDFVFSGSFNEAVSTLLEKNSNIWGIKGKIYSENQAEAFQVRKSRPAGHQNKTLENIQVGADLQLVMEDLSNKAGVKLVWQSFQSFNLKEPLKENISYDQAIRFLLEQYQDDKIRPVGRLNTDPRTGEKVLIVHENKHVFSGA